MGEAFQPGGKRHSIEVGAPASPGLTQYVCHLSRISSRRATVTVCPGAMAGCSDTRLALTCSVLGKIPDCAKAGEVSARSAATSAKKRPKNRIMQTTYNPSRALKKAKRALSR